MSQPASHNFRKESNFDVSVVVKLFRSFSFCGFNCFHPQVEKKLSVFVSAISKKADAARNSVSVDRRRKTKSFSFRRLGLHCTSWITPVVMLFAVAACVPFLLIHPPSERDNPKMKDWSSSISNSSTLSFLRRSVSGVNFMSGGTSEAETCKGYTECHAKRVFIAIETQASHISQRKLLRSTWLTYTERYPDTLEWRFFIHGSAAGLNATKRDLSGEVQLYNDIIFAPVKLNKVAASSYSSYKSFGSTSSYSGSRYGIPYVRKSNASTGYSYKKYNSSKYSKSYPKYTSPYSKYSRSYDSSHSVAKVSVEEQPSGLDRNGRKILGYMSDWAHSRTSSAAKYSNYPSKSSSTTTPARFPKRPGNPVVTCLSKERPASGSCTTPRWTPEVQQVAWALQHNVDFAYFLHVTDNGLLCVDWLMQELKYRPSERFVWGRFNCGLQTKDPPTMDPSFVLMSRDVAEWWLMLQNVENWKTPPAKPIPFDALMAVFELSTLDDQERLVGPSTVATFLADYDLEVKQKSSAGYGYGSSSYGRSYSGYSYNQSSRWKSSSSPWNSKSTSTSLYSTRRYNSSWYSNYRTYSKRSNTSTVSATGLGRSLLANISPYSSRYSSYSRNSGSSKASGPVFCKRFMWASDLIHAPPSPKKSANAAKPNVSMVRNDSKINETNTTMQSDSVSLLGQFASFLGFSGGQPAQAVVGAHTDTTSASALPAGATGTAAATATTETRTTWSSPWRRLLALPTIDDEDDIVKSAQEYPGKPHSPVSVSESTPAAAAAAALGLGPSSEPAMKSQLKSSPDLSTLVDKPLPNQTLLGLLFNSMKSQQSKDWEVGKRQYTIMGPLCSAPPNRPVLAEAEVKRAAKYHRAHVIDQGLKEYANVYKPMHIHIGTYMDIIGQIVERHQERRLRTMPASYWPGAGRAGSTVDHEIEERLHQCHFDPKCMIGVLNHLGIVRDLWWQVDERRAKRCCATKVPVLRRCSQYRSRTFLSGKDNNATMLASFPGSGNTWARMLLEYGSGYYTGSTYDDVDLMDLMPGEGRDDGSVIAVKTHTSPKEFVQRVQPGAVIFLVRHPYNALWAEFQRRKAGDHAGALTEMSSYAVQLEFPRFAGCMACKWLQFVALHVHLKATGVRLFVLKYEDLVTAPKESLQSLLGFVGLPERANDLTRMDCAAQLSNQKSIHRVKKITANDVFHNRTDVACRVWSTITRDPAARLLLMSLGYRNYAADELACQALLQFTKSTSTTCTVRFDISTSLQGCTSTAGSY